ncbi:MAG: 50S ribosomal protein L6 [Thermoplasmatales archaeon]|nr:MAG: 50S ribosomal protein L6 [Thermoplasmatales archaeon]
MPETTELKEEIKIPNGVEVSMEEKTIHVKSEKGSLSKILSHPKINIKIKDNIVEISCSKSPHRKEKALIGTFSAHIRNMIKGVTEGFEYKMKTLYSHFPIKTIVEGNEFIIQNFLGERSPRKAKILENVEVKTMGDNVTVSGIDKEKVGQTVANIERATRVKKRDIRVFQDGVYLISKRG